MSKRIDVHHVTRVEGHGNIVVEVAGGQLKECRFDVVETPRFFEAMLIGRPYLEASHITFAPPGTPPPPCGLPRKPSGSS